MFNGEIRKEVKEKMDENIEKIMEEVIKEGVKKINKEIKKMYEIEEIKQRLEKKYKEEIRMLEEKIEKMNKELEGIKKSEKNKVKVDSEKKMEDVKEKEGECGMLDKEKSGFVKEYTRQNWRYNLEYRKKLIRVAKGDNFEMTRRNVEEWIKERLEEDEKGSLELVRR